MKRLSLTLLLFAATLCAQPPPLMLGVVEDVMGPLEQDPHTRGVRAVFYKSGDEWKAFSPECMTQECLQKFVPDFPKEQSWTIAFDGKNIGRVTTRTAIKQADLVRFSHLQILTQPVPVIGSATEEFAGFLGTAVLRPLVAVSQPNFKDPDLWKPTVLEPAKAALVRQEFVKKYPKITDCEVEEIHETKVADIKVTKSYAAKSGWRMVSASVKGCDANDVQATAGLDYEWFTIDPAGAAHYLASNLVLVDAGDYDNSGHSQILLMIDDYNRGGYVLFYDGFQKSARFEYRFH